MALEHDCMEESIDEMIHMLFLNLNRNKDDDKFEKEYSDIEMKNLIDNKEINKAEDLIYDQTNFSSIVDLERILLFYKYLNTKDSEYLKECDYSKEEIKDGVKTVARKCGLENLMILFN